MTAPIYSIYGVNVLAVLEGTYIYMQVGFGFMVFNATFNNISVILWWSVLLVEEIGVPGENQRPAESH
jgi:hypothetical protein